MAAQEHLNDGQFGDYQTGHRPAGSDYGAPMHDVESMFPDYHKRPDIYRTYSSDKRVDPQTHRALAAARDRPDADVTVYRAMPNNGQGINPGDWVTPSRSYAEIHKESNGQPDWQIAQRTVKAKHLYTEGNYIPEWGWHPE